MKFKVTDHDTGEVHYVSGEQLARRQPRPPKNVRSWPPMPTDLNRDVTIKLIRDALKKRSGKVWSVKGGRGTAWGWIHIDAPPARRKYDSDGHLTTSGLPDSGYMSHEDQAELTLLLGLDRPVHFQGQSIAASSDYYREHIQRARGQKPTVIGTPYWD